MENLTRAHIVILGRVQGVFYRMWMQEEAGKLELKGWVKNTNDGKVEAVFEGPEGKIKQMIEKCKEGSRFAKVTNIDVKWEKATGEFDSFEIKY